MTIKTKTKALKMSAAALGLLTAMSGSAVMAEDIGFVLAGPDIYYRTEADMFTKLAKAAGHSVTVANSEYSPSKELANVEDFIARGVDVIVLLSGNAESGTQAAERATDAGIPIFFVAALPSPAGYDIPTGMVSGDWIGMGHTIGTAIGTAHPGENVALIEGVYGQGIAEMIRQGFEAGIADAGGGNEIVLESSGGWSRNGGLEVTQDYLASDKDFSVIYAMNEEMMAGTIQALDEAGRTGEISLYSSNGKEIGWEWMKEGTMLGTVANTPTLEADLVYQMVERYLAGEDFPRHVYNVQPMLTAENIDTAVPWEIDAYMAKRDAGVLDNDLMSQTEITSMVTWSSNN
ncbi:sugar ABC transporter substrate-binding protein [Pacificibacter marinus]|uniref:sugar ABC transporter substrate-binding protein n=1 Tax=Pacificibacter marinus TaxID=658057 RepID=UPI001C06CD14|nr:substrate-binding domain-containing protein [Pacificibacter marinus]MBU2867254.1 substrate-binding domain-containing protein [Pacificibacter marinus]